MSFEEEDYDMDMGTGEEDEYLAEEDIESELEHLKDFGNEKQLKLLRSEIGHINAHGLIPNEGWYDERFQYIDMYSKLEWGSLMERFKNKDDYMFTTSIYIMRLLGELLEERSTKPNFNLLTYQSLIHNIYSIWNYFKNEYLGDENDSEMFGLLEGMRFLST